MLKEIKTSVYEPLYTLTEAEKIIDLQRVEKEKYENDYIAFWKYIRGNEK